MPLFELGGRKPTTREIALTVKTGGTAALTEADRRADAASYQEVTCRSALNRVQGMPFNWTLNSYRGCTHGCHYCFARRYHAQFEMNAGDEFASVILVKTNVIDVLVQGARSAVVEAGASRCRHRDRSLPADRGPLPAHAPRHRSLRTRENADRPDHERADGRSRSRCAARSHEGGRLHGLHERSDGRRRRVAIARARHRPPAAAPARRPRARRRRHQCRRADGADRPRLHVVALEARAHDQGDCGSWRPLRRLQRHAPAGRHARALHEFHQPRVPRDAAAVRTPVRGRVRAGRLSRGGAKHGAGASEPLRRRAASRITGTTGGSREPRPKPSRWGSPSKSTI